MIIMIIIFPIIGNLLFMKKKTSVSLHVDNFGLAGYLDYFLLCFL